MEDYKRRALEGDKFTLTVKPPSRVWCLGCLLEWVTSKEGCYPILLPNHPSYTEQSATETQKTHGKVGSLDAIIDALREP